MNSREFADLMRVCGCFTLEVNPFTAHHISSGNFGLVLQMRINICGSSVGAVTKPVLRKAMIQDGATMPEVISVLRARQRDKPSLLRGKLDH